MDNSVLKSVLSGNLHPWRWWLRRWLWSIENFSSPLNSTTSTMRDINATRRPFSTRCCSATWRLDGTSTRRRIRDACSSARLADTVVHLAAPPSARRPLKTHTANKCAGITRCMTRRHSHTCSGCAKPFTFRANNCSWCVKPLNISRQFPFRMRELVIHFAPTLFRLQKGTFRVTSTFHKKQTTSLPWTFVYILHGAWSEWNILQSTISTSREQFVYILYSQLHLNFLKWTRLSLDNQEDTCSIFYINTC